MAVRPPERPGALVRNRRKRYLELNPDYFDDDLEYADPLLYDRLVRRWFSRAELDAQRHQRGFSRVLESDLRRGEARLDAAQSGDATVRVREDQQGQVTTEFRINDQDDDAGDDVFEEEEEDQDDVDDDRDSDEPPSRQDDYAEWRRRMQARFVAGQDGDFDYARVDDDSDLDDSPEGALDRHMAYVDAEEPEFLVPEDQRKGETGIQDY